MTVSERLNKRLKGFIPDVDVLLVDQGLNPDDTYTKEIGKSGEFQLAVAYGLVEVLENPNLSEGDWSRSWGDRSAVEKLISSIFNRFAPEENPYSQTLKYIQTW